jgi:hypothetical protein
MCEVTLFLQLILMESLYVCNCRRQLDFVCASFSPTTNPALPPLPPARCRSSRRSSPDLDQSAIGCAIFVNTRRLEVAQARRVVLRDFAAPLLQGRGGGLAREVAGKWHSIALAQLRLRATGPTLVGVSE